MFKIDTKSTFTHDVLVLQPCDDGYAEHKLRTTFRRLSKEELSSFVSIGDVEQQIEYVNAIVERFHDIVDDSDKPLTDDAEVKRTLVDDAGVRLALMTHYATAMIGGRRKN